MVHRPSDPADAFGDTLRHYRVRAGLSQEDLANQCGLHRTFISQLERALKSPSLRTIWILADALDVRPHQLVRETENRMGS